MRSIFTALALLPALAAAEDKLSVLILDGQNNHNWKATTPVLQELLEETGIYKVTVSTTPGKGADEDAWKDWKPEFAKYDAVLSNYNGEMWPKKEQRAFIRYVRSGGALVIVHAANNSFGKWEDYNEMIGVGGWGGRKLVRDGAWLHAVDGKIVRDESTEGGAGSHGPRHPFVVEHIDSDHPITKGLPSKWLHAKDELYCKLCGPAKNVEVQGVSLSPQTKRYEPMLMTITYSKGRIFHTPMGHDVEAMRCRGFYELVQRGTEWAITGEVTKTAEVPADFPTETEVTTVPEK